ncbi:MAG TPA: CARDB domain-containing protein [Candidatus Thermoplasmatota archaeon]|nr:CARDB domain-containing protein [Candidatus Thermoplasmatota archaeon]
MTRTSPIPTRFRTLTVALLLLLATPALAAGAAASAGAPDLVVLEVFQSPADARPGEPVLFSALVANAGHGPAGAFAVVFETESRWLGGFFHAAGLGAGERLVVSATENATAPRGDLAVLVTVDRWMQVSESDESNNERVAVFSYDGVAGPDLRFDAIDVSPANPRVGDEIQTTARFTNAADRPAGEFWVSFFDDLSREERSWYARGLGAGETLEVVFTHRTSAAGAATVSVIADLYGNLEERDGGNNGGWATYEVSGPAGPDLAVLRMWTDPAIPVDGEPVHVFAEVANLGDVDAPESFARWELDGQGYGHSRFPPLASGVATTYGMSIYYAQEGARTMALEVDSTGAIAEANEDNNGGSLSYDVAPSPHADLVVAHMTIEGSSVEGEVQEIVATIRNKGHGDAGASQVRFVLDHVHDLGTVSVPPLAAGAEARVTLEWVAERGAHRIRAFADAAREVVEVSDLNNEMELYFGILPKPRFADLRVRIVSVEKDEIQTDAGDVANSLAPIRIVVETCNIGGATFHGGGLSVWARAVAGGIQTLDSVADAPLVALEAGSCESHAFRWNRDRAAVGDVEIHARGYSTAWGEVDPENNRDVKRTFLFAGNTGLGGVILP